MTAALQSNDAEDEDLLQYEDEGGDDNNHGEQPVAPSDDISNAFLDDLTDEEEGEHPEEACALAKLCDKLCEDYELCGMNIPDRLGVSVLEPEIADRYTAYCVPTSPHGGWRRAIDVAEKLLEDQLGVFQELLEEAKSKYIVNKPLQAQKGGLAVAPKLLPTCASISKQNGKFNEQLHGTCTAATIVAQQRNGMPLCQCSLHGSMPDWNHLRWPALFCNICASICLSGHGLDEHPEVWKKKLADPRRRIILKFLVLGWTYQNQEICAKLNREPPIPIPKRGSEANRMAKELAIKAGQEKKAQRDAKAQKGKGRGRSRGGKGSPHKKQRLHQPSMNQFVTPSGKGSQLEEVTGDKPSNRTTSSVFASPIKPHALRLTETETQEILAKALAQKQIGATLNQ
jgi:hypothetical protein